jgi:hypothetical protein
LKCRASEWDRITGLRVSSLESRRRFEWSDD